MSTQSAPPYLTLEIDRTAAPDLIVVRCRGALVYGVTDVLSSGVRLLIPHTKRIILDLGDLTYMDSMGLGTLVRLYASSKASGCQFDLIHLGKRVKELLALTNLLSVFSIIGEHSIKPF